MSTKLGIPLLALATCACYNWRTEPLLPDAALTSIESRVMRLTLVDGSKIEVVDP